MRLRVSFIHYGADVTIMPNVLAATDEYMEDEHGSLPPFYLDMLDEVGPDDVVRECFIEVPDEQVLDLFQNATITAQIARSHERESAVGPSCSDCDVTMLLPWEDENTVSIREVDGWTFTSEAGWRCPDHAAMDLNTRASSDG